MSEIINEPWKATAAELLKFCKSMNAGTLKMILCDTDGVPVAAVVVIAEDAPEILEAIAQIEDREVN